MAIRMALAEGSAETDPSGSQDRERPTADRPESLSSGLTQIGGIVEFQDLLWNRAKAENANETGS